MDLFELVRSKAPEILELAEKHGAENIRIFGSVARGDSDEKSDIDFLIDKGPKEKWSAWFPGSLIVDLESLLGMKVDICTNKMFKPSNLEKVLKEAIPICEMMRRE